MLAAIIYNKKQNAEKKIKQDLKQIKFITADHELLKKFAWQHGHGYTSWICAIFEPKQVLEIGLDTQIIFPGVNKAFCNFCW